MRHPAPLIALVLAVGIAGAALALSGHEGNARFVAQQQDLLPVRATALQRLILTTSDPRPGYGGRTQSARCASAGTSALGNPWSCVVRYPRLPRIVYRVGVHADRSIYGTGHPEGAGTGTPLIVRGCCVGAP